MVHDENYTSFVVSLLVHKIGAGEGALILHRPIVGRLFKGGGGGGANSRIFRYPYSPYKGVHPVKIIVICQCYFKYKIF